MSPLKNKIDFAVLVLVNMANANGDPLNGNRPRTDYNGFGEISDVCIKRKIRNRMQDMNNGIFVQSDDRRIDEYNSLESRAKGTLPLVLSKTNNKKTKNNPTNDKITKEDFTKAACEKYMDVRSFGQVFAFGDKNDDEGSVSVGIRGPVSIHQAISISPIDIRSFQITKSVNGKETKDGKKGSDTIGMKHFVHFGLYEIKGSINVQLAEKTGFSEEDAEVIKECLRTLFVNDASSARPDGSMEVYKVYWWKHNCKDGQYSSARVHHSLHVTPKDENKIPSSIDDYVITLDTLEGLAPEIINGL